VEGGINLVVYSNLLLVFQPSLLYRTLKRLHTFKHQETIGIFKMDVDKMFKLPALPSGAGNKRKFPDAPAPGKSSCL
jgi:hypothetical protein